jgi:7-keto-8-aminopelargonate synthetase-like enzyme
MVDLSADYFTFAQRRRKSRGAKMGIAAYGTKAGKSRQRRGNTAAPTPDTMRSEGSGNSRTR